MSCSAMRYRVPVCSEVCMDNDESPFKFETQHCHSAPLGGVYYIIASLAQRVSGLQDACATRVSEVCGDIDGAVV